MVNLRTQSLLQFMVRFFAKTFMNFFLDDMSYVSNKLIKNINPENIKKNLRYFTTDPHPAGTEANNRLADKIAETWRQNGLEGNF